MTRARLLRCSPVIESQRSQSVHFSSSCQTGCGHFHGLRGLVHQIVGVPPRSMDHCGQHGRDTNTGQRTTTSSADHSTLLLFHVVWCLCIDMQQTNRSQPCDGSSGTVTIVHRHGDSRVLFPSCARQVCSQLSGRWCLCRPQALKVARSAGRTNESWCKFLVQLRGSARTFRDDGSWWSSGCVLMQPWSFTPAGISDLESHRECGRSHLPANGASRQSESQTSTPGDTRPLLWLFMSIPASDPLQCRWEMHWSYFRHSMGLWDAPQRHQQVGTRLSQLGVQRGLPPISKKNPCQFDCMDWALLVHHLGGILPPRKSGSATTQRSAG